MEYPSELQLVYLFCVSVRINHVLNIYYSHVLVLHTDGPFDSNQTAATISTHYTTQKPNVNSALWCVSTEWCGKVRWGAAHVSTTDSTYGRAGFKPTAT